MARPPVPIFGISKPDVPKFSSRDDDDEVFGRTHLHTTHETCHATAFIAFTLTLPTCPAHCSLLLCPEHFIRARHAHEPLVSHSRVAGDCVWLQDKHHSLQLADFFLATRGPVLLWRAVASGLSPSACRVPKFVHGG